MSAVRGQREENKKSSMESAERRKSPAKTSRKGGGKPGKTLTAEEEARRREAVKERLRERLELERRALQVVERFLEDRVSEDFLLDSAKFITLANYKDTVEERFITKLCGYPICPNKLGKIPTQQYKISTKTNRVYDITERKCFCSNFCYKASKEFELQISKTPLWLRQHESPPEIKLLKTGDGGSSGEEVMLSERRLKEDDVENPQATLPENLHGSPQIPTGGDSSDGEQEQDFVSSVLSQQDRPSVHWGDMQKRSDQDKKVEQRRKQNREGFKKETERHQIHNTEEENVLRDENERSEPEADKLHTLNTHQERDSLEDQSVEEATAKINECSLSETDIPNTHTETENKASLTSRSSTGTTPSSGSKHGPSTALTASEQNSHNPAGLSITQVGMSKKGAAGLRDLLKNHAAETKPDSVRLSLLEGLKTTLKEWCTEETLKFLYGDGHSLVSSFANEEEEKGEEEELDEDDLDDDVTAAVARGQKRPSTPAPDYELLRRQTEQLELRVREFYKGAWLLPEEEQRLDGNKTTVQDQITSDPALPLIDSHAQHLIQKRIVVEKLNSCSRSRCARKLGPNRAVPFGYFTFVFLRSVVGPLGLTLSDISTDLNNLVRTFRFSNTNIGHRTPEWTLVAVVLLHLLSEVSPVVQDALETSASVQYLNTLMEELDLQEQDLLSLVQMFKPPTHPHQ
ncbi:putative RNA polymerase II subunit B1 CTD phosphatase rpap2 isoform X2 [Kryptolebias marmoratus]|uniref:putative RNA polymerase II subunit B1 CTD phosphatase rpap2 isoform X2 n=1 Tax=Kryptolebias marmoratus TaxID=37003 RepID=UPI000D52F375|nr:putative RNA polymerase II subunit B1 CTD phosphatase rpap2 isoform X2 [Kryptolebias marmoratus]